MRSRTGSPRILSWRIASPQRSFLPVPPLEKGNEDSGNEIVLKGENVTTEQFFIVNCAVPENIHTHPNYCKEGHWKFQRERDLKSQTFYKLNWKFLWGGGGQTKKPSMGVVWIYSGTTH